MSNLQDNLFGAIENLVSRTIESTPIDTTVTAEIALLKNVEIGEYKVTYQGDTFSAYSMDPLTLYSLGEQVYVLVPKGDFSSKKVILGKAAFNDKVSYTDRQAMSNQWRTRGPNWLCEEWYWRDTNGGYRNDAREASIVVSKQEDDTNIVHPSANWRDYLFYRDGLPAANEQNYTEIRKEKTKLPTARPATTDTGRDILSGVDADFQLWGAQMDYIMVKANFETLFLNTHNSGEYGLLLECFTENPRFGVTGYEDESQYNLMSFKLGFGDFNGAPFSFAQPTPQQAIFPVPRGVLKGLARVSLFQTDGWNTDIQPVSVSILDPTIEDPNGSSFTFVSPPAKKVLNRNNVEATNVEIYWCEPVNLEDRLFWLKMEAVKGTSLNNTPGSESAWITELPLRARLMYGGEDITSEETCKFVWFRQKYSALRDLAEASEPDKFGNTWAHYLPEGENGWAPIEQMIKTPEEDPYLGENATYKLGKMNDSSFLEDDYFHEALMIPIEEVSWQWRYMVVCYYNPNGGTLEEIQRSKINDALIWTDELVRNTSSIHDFELTAPTIAANLSDIHLRVRNNNLPWIEGEVFDPFNPVANDPKRDWYCRWWWASGQTYNAMQVDDDPQQQRFHKGKRRIDQLLLNEPITFKAQIYGKRAPNGATREEQIADAAQVWPDPPETDNPDMALEYNEYEIANIERAIIPTDGALVHVDFIGQRNHNYNSDGKIRLSEMANTQFNIRAILTPRDESIVIFSAEWLAPDRTPLKSLSADEVIAGTGYTPTPQIGMLQDMWMSVPNQDNDERALHYKVSDTYDIDKVGVANNTFILLIRFLNGVVQEVPCEITFQKADSNGSQGSEWTAQIWPCNSTPTLDGINAVGYTPWSKMIQDHPRPLVVDGDSEGYGSSYRRKDDFRLFLRPFIRRNGLALESLNEATKYTYKVFWDVRQQPVVDPTSPRGLAANGSFLELSHQGISGRNLDDLGKDGDLATGIPYARGETEPNNLKNLQAYTHSLDKEGKPYSGTAETGQPTFGAIEVRWANRNRINGVSMTQLDYNFVVRARIEIYYNGVAVASINSFYGADILFTNGSLINSTNFVPSKIKTNWPKEVQYTSTGVAPKLANEKLSFLYGDSNYLNATTDPYPMTATPINLTPKIQELNIDTNGLNVRGEYSNTAIYSRTDEATDVISYEGFFFAVREKGDLPSGTAPDRLAENDKHWRKITDLTNWKLLPRAYYFFEEWDNGALATDIVTNTGKWPSDATINPDFEGWGNAVYIRPVIYYLSQYGNDNINGWDGKSIDLREEDGTLFAPTIGAGWKHPFTNTFSGVVMGIDSSQLKKHYSAEYGGFSDDNISQNPYMTGLYGYQDGISSFGIMENGTAYFGRADRGGRIVVDGYNAQIYGGVSTKNLTGLEADMRNRMRLSFIDFGGAANQINENYLDEIDSIYEENLEAFNKIFEEYEIFTETIDQDQYNRDKEYRKIVDEKYAEFEADMAAIQGGVTPGTPVDGQPGIALGAFVVNQDIKLTSLPSKNQWFGNFHDYFAPGIGTAVDPLAARYGGYFTGHSFSTPAIEIGSYETWMKDSNGRRKIESRPDWRRNDSVYRNGAQLIRKYTIKQIQETGIVNGISNLEIPGFRKFLVTYDGTLYAMNAFIKGNLISSNIIGSQFFNADGSFVVTEDGNLGIGKGKGDWTKEKIRSGYSSGWSGTPPRTENVRVSNYLIDGDRNQRKDFQDGGFGFYVSYDGTVICRDIHIAGGSLSIGDFHIIGAGEGDNLKTGDVVSYGTMYLVGQKDLLPGFGTPAVEAWGDFNLRGRLVNLGPVFLGGRTEKDAPGTAKNPSSWQTQPSSFNSPFSILPASISTGSPNSDPALPVEIGVWPLYFRCGSQNGSSNDTWVTLSSNLSTSLNNGFMPGFSQRTNRTFPGAGYQTLPSQITWRVDRLGMWTDGIIFSNKDWASMTDTTKADFGFHAETYLGWGEDSGVNSFIIKNISYRAPNIVMSAPETIRLSTENSSSQIVLKTGNASYDPKLLVSSANDILAGIAKTVWFEGDGSFLSLNALGDFESSGRNIRDELGDVIATVPRADSSAIWGKARTIALDGMGSGDSLDSGEDYNAMIRINRSASGGTGNIGWPSDVPGRPSTPLGYQGTVLLLAKNAIVLQGVGYNASLQCNIAPSRQYGIYARFA